MSMKILFYFTYLILFLFLSHFSISQTVWKSDGSVVVGGVVKKEAYSERYKKQIKNPSNAWRKAKFSSESIPEYFGNGQFLPGMPLLRMTAIDKGEDYLAALAEKNGFSNKSMLQRFIVSAASPDFLDDLGISEEEALIYASSGLDLEIESDDPLYAVMKKFDNNISSNLSSKIDNEVQKQVQKQVEDQVQKQVEDQVEEAIENSFESWWDNYIDDLISSGATIISRDDNSVTYTYD